MPKANFGAVVATFGLCFGFWLLLTWTFAVQELIAGAIIALVVALFCARFFIHGRAFYLLHPRRLAALLWYCLAIFPLELLKANWDVARRSLAPRLPIKPGIVKVEVGLRGEYAQVMLANSITLTPGTITIDIVEEDGRTYYYIHWLAVAGEPEQAGEIIKGRLERGIRRVWS